MRVACGSANAAQNLWPGGRGWRGCPPRTWWDRLVTFGSDAQKFSLAGGAARSSTGPRPRPARCRAGRSASAGNIAAFSKSVQCRGQAVTVLRCRQLCRHHRGRVGCVHRNRCSRRSCPLAADDAARAVANVLLPPWPTPSPAGRDETGRRSVSIQAHHRSVQPTRRSVPSDSTGRWGFHDAAADAGRWNIDISSPTSVKAEPSRLVTAFGPRDAFSEAPWCRSAARFAAVFGGIGAGCITARGTSAGFCVVCRAARTSLIVPSKVEASLMVLKPNERSHCPQDECLQQSGDERWRTSWKPPRAYLAVRGAHRRHHLPHIAFKPRYYGALHRAIRSRSPFTLDWSAGGPSTAALGNPGPNPRTSPWRIISGLSDEPGLDRAPDLRCPAPPCSRGRRPIGALRFSAVLILCSFQVILAGLGRANAIAACQNGFLVGSIDDQPCPRRSADRCEARACRSFIDQPGDDIDREP